MADHSTATASAIATVRGRSDYGIKRVRTAVGRITVIGSGEPVGGFVVQAIDASRNRSLGSTQVGADGQFSIQFEVGVSRRLWSAPRACPLSIQLNVSAPERPSDCDDDRLLLCTKIRRNTTGDQYFLIELPKEQVDAMQLPGQDDDLAVDNRIAMLQANRTNVQRIAAAKNEFLKFDLEFTEERDKLFRDKICGTMEKKLSLLTESQKESKEYVPDQDSIESVTLSSAVADLEPLLPKEGKQVPMKPKS